MTPAQALDAYNSALLAGRYDEAFALLPQTLQDGYAGPTAYGEQMRAYEITACEAGAPIEEGDEVRIESRMTAKGLELLYTWTYVKFGDAWLVKSRVNTPQ